MQDVDEIYIGISQAGRVGEQDSPHPTPITFKFIYTRLQVLKQSIYIIWGLLYN
jgi:hypothetical protein